MTELEKYQKIYSGQLPEFSFYGHSNHGSDAYDFVENFLRPNSILDLGCGHNEFCHHFKDRMLRCVGVDFACPSADVMCPITELPFGDKEFHLVTAFDVLEHLRPEEVEPALMEMARVSRMYLVSIAYRPSLWLVEGENLHPTVQPEAEWINALLQHGLVGRHGRYLYGIWYDEFQK